MGSNLKKEAMERVGEVEHAECYYDTDRNMPLPGAALPSAHATIIAAKAGEIAALTAEVTHLAEKLAERDAKAGSVGDDPVFRNIIDGWLGADGEVYKRLVAYLDSRSSSAPSVDRNSVLEEVRREVSEMRNHLEAFSEYSQETARCVLDGVVDAIDEMMAEPAAAPQPVDAAQAVPQWMPIETAPKDGRTLLLGRFNSMGNWRTLRGQWFTKEVIDDEWEETEGFEAGWYETSVEPDFPNCWETSPTHWQPLPAAPVAQPTDTTKPLTRCAAGRDGDCSNAQCPQLRDNEPRTSGRHCPLDITKDTP